MKKGIKPIGSYILVKDYEQVKDDLYKGIVHMSNNKNIHFDDVIHFNYKESILIPEYDLIAVKWFETIFKDVYIEEPKTINFLFDNMDTEL